VVIDDHHKYRIRPKSYYEYKLKGVVVHRGTAQYGHYYSYVNYKAEKWIELNDSTIRDFDPRKIPQECYGGKESESANDDIINAPKVGPNN
jgi:ubiquitin carboxyl-terminal hydrolase 34